MYFPQQQADLCRHLVRITVVMPSPFFVGYGLSLGLAERGVDAACTPAETQVREVAFR